MNFLRTIKLFLLFLVLASCSPISVDQSLDVEGEIELSEGVPVGQSFVAKNDGLSGISFYFKPQKENRGEIVIHLRSNSTSEDDLAHGTFSIDQIIEPGFYELTFNPQSKSHRQYFYAVMEIEGANGLLVGSSPGISYLHGSAYIDHEPIDFQTTFQLHYDRGFMIVGVVNEFLTWMATFLAGLFLYIIPGLALVSILWPKSIRISRVVKIAIAIGVSLALYPALFLWTDLVNLHLGSLYAWLPGASGIVILVGSHHTSLRTERIKHELSRWIRSPEIAHDLSFITIVLIIFFVRMIAIRDIDVPLWGDSYQHSMMAQLLVDNGGLFNSWQPYADLTTFTYHFGFHSQVAIFSWVTGLPAYRATLLVGQILNGFAAISLYPLATRLGNKKWAGIFAVLIAGLLVQMPMFYTNWGRYTQLAGQVILPIAAFIIWSLLEQRNVHWGLLSLSWLLMGGLALTHYRILIFAILLFPILIVVSMKRIGFREPIIRTFLIGLVSAGLFLPWFIRIFEGRILDNFVYQISTPASSTPSFLSSYNSIGDLTQFLPIAVWLLLGLSILWVAWKKNTDSLVIIIWWTLIFLSANPQLLGLPGVGTISNFAVLIGMYIPASLLIGGLASTFLTKKLIKRTSVMLVLGLIILSVWGGVQQIDRIDPIPHSLATRPDLNAAKWLEQNLPESSHLLVNSFFAYGDTVIAGTDGGWWLPLLADIKTTLPPLTYGVEQGIQPDYLSQVNLLASKIAAKGINNPEILEDLKNWGVTHIFIGQLQGRVNYSGPLVFDPQVLKSSDQFRVIYNIDRVWIFEVVY